MINGKTRLAGVMGWPVSHSLSPVIHNAWFRQTGINGVYVPFPVKPEELEQAVRGMAAMGVAGVNLTIPHKEWVLPLCDEVDEAAKRIGAVNTVLFKEGKMHGFNTDAYGFWQNLEERARFVRKHVALVLGAGGAARAVVAALDAAGFGTIYVMNRTFAKAEQFKTLSPKVVPLEWNANPAQMKEVDLLVNTTSLGMKGEASLEIDLSPLPSYAVVTDIVYTPLITPLLAQAQERGFQVVDGLGMLLYQAQKAFHIWFGQEPVVDDALRQKVLEHLLC